MHIPVVLCTFMGLTLMMTTDIGALNASVSNDGRLLEMEAEQVADTSVHTLKPAAPPAGNSSAAATQLILGMVLLVIGFSIHALMTMKKEDRSVHVSIKRPSSAADQAPKRSRRYMALYWLE